MTWIATSADCQKLSVEVIGGKALSLAKLSESGLNVPRWFCVKTDAYKDLFEEMEPNLWKQIQSHQDQEHSDRMLRDYLDRSPVIKRNTGIILAAFDEHFGVQARVAVRSSAVSEDSENASYAGQFATYLNVDRSELVARVSRCIQSSLSFACHRYRSVLGSEEDVLTCAVVVQAMVPAKKSGVLFTANPIDSNSSSLVVTAAYGLGEGVVSDLSDVDTFYVSRTTGRITHSDVMRKRRQVTGNPQENGTVVTSVNEKISDEPVLLTHELESLRQGALAIVGLFDCELDIEWAIGSDGTLFFLQARPITTLQTKSALFVFDSSNISENYRGATTPLTYSYVRKYYEDIFVGVATMFGMEKRELYRSKNVFRYLVGFVNGGIYYNLVNWYRMFHIVPGFSYFKTPFEHGVGLDGAPEQLTEEIENYPSRKPQTLLAQFVTYCRLAGNFIALPLRIKALRKRFEECQEMVKEKEREANSAAQLLNLYESVQLELSANWGAPLLNDYYTFIFHHALHRLAPRWGFDEDESFISSALRSDGDIASVKPVKAILHLAETARNIPNLPDLIHANRPDAYDVIKADSRFSIFFKEFEDYISKHGDRRFDELKLESPALRETPELVLSLIANYLRSPVTPGVYRGSSEAKADADRYRPNSLMGNPFRRCVVSLLIWATKRGLVIREYGRLVRSQRCGLERFLLHKIADRMVAEGVLTDRTDIHFLTLEEISAASSGCSIAENLGTLIAGRRADHVQHKLHEHPIRIVVDSRPDGIPKAPGKPDRSKALDNDEQSLLIGLGCSHGVVRGRARLVRDPSSAQLEPGDIIVARATDPAWVFLMAAASALIVERGNLLSHASIIGRELGIPCVIGITEAMLKIPDLSNVVVDGKAGTVKVEKPTSYTHSTYISGQVPA